MDPVAVEGICLAAAELGYEWEIKIWGDEFVVVTYPDPAQFEWEGRTWKYGAVSAEFHEFHGCNVRVYVEDGPDGVHPHVSERKLCAGNWEDCFAEAWDAGEWKRLVLLAYEAACHYTYGSAYRELSGECALCGEGSDGRHCENCGAEICDNCNPVDDLCSDCAQRCPDCGEYAQSLHYCDLCNRERCSACLHSCDGCGARGCDRCVTDDLCDACHKAREEEDETEVDG